MEVKMEENENVLALDCSQALALIKKISEGRVIHPLNSSALDEHIKGNEHIEGCLKCAERLNEITKGQKE